MRTNVLEYLEETVKRVPEKIAFSDGTDALTFSEVSDRARRIGSFLARQRIENSPVVVFMKKHPATVSAFFGVLYSGNYYVPLDPEMPKFRIDMILKQVKPKAIICGEEVLENADVLSYDKLCKTEIDEAALTAVRDAQIDTDPIYIVFTSGSTGIPKGVMACHRSVIDYVESLSSVLHFSEETVFANQAPLYFDACLKELYPTCKFGAMTYLVPKQLFSFPVKLVEYLNEHKVNTLCWVVSALTTVSALGTFRTVLPQYVHTVAFAGEVFPMKQLNIWREALPNTRYINLYGPTEATGVSCYYEVDREFTNEETLPVGRPLPNTGLLLLNENGQKCAPGQAGEICLRGTCLTLGYYADFERTDAAFVRNPANSVYPEIIYRTGDYGRYNERGELTFISRKDHQIKHMGHRIELGEIEVVVSAIDGIYAVCCLFDKETKKLILYYTGEKESKELAGILRNTLPRYMVPHAIRKLDAMPLTSNGKVNRTELMKYYQEK